MTNSTQRRNKYRAGFTLTELLVGLAILIVLFAIGMLSLTTLRRNLRQKELDSKAEIIYVAAQNRLAELRAAGYQSVYEYGTANNGVRQLGYTPSDVASDTTFEDDTLCYVDSADKTGNASVVAAAAILPQEAVDNELWSHCWRIEYDPISGSVYSVFYTEQDELPAELNTLRARKARLNAGARVGYYGGDLAQVDTTDKLRPDISIKNAEELTVDFYCNNPVTDTASSLTFEITLSTGKKTFTKTVSSANNELIQVNSRTYRYRWVLDSLKSEAQRFVNQTQRQLDCGTELSITLTVSSSNPLIDKESRTRKTNSLFAYDEQNTKADTAYLAYGRHLQNLDKDSGVSEKITKAVQISDISFQDDMADSEDWYSLYGETFQPVTNNNLTSYDGHSQSVSGDLYASIYGLHIPDQGGAEAGLFRAYSGKGLSISNVTMTGVKAAGGTDVGAIIGKAERDVTLENCQVYLSAKKGDLENIAVKEKAEDVEPWLQGQVVGGLIGRSASGAKVQIKNSLASTVLSGTQNAGGLVAMAEGELRVEGSYADCYLQAQTTGGLVGGAASGASIYLKDFYAAGYQTAQSTAAGLAAGTLVRAENGYAAFDYTAKDNLTIYTTAVQSAFTQNVYYLSGFGASSTQMTGTVPKGYKELSDNEMLTLLTGDVFTLSSANATFAYNLLDQGLQAYSYPRLKTMNHYGDWQAEFESGALVYYEVYKDEDGTYSYGFSGANASTLRTDCVAVGDGYALAYNEQPEADLFVSVLYDIGPDGTGKTHTLPAGQTLQSNTATDKYYLVPLPASITNTTFVDTTGADSFYQKLVINDSDIYYYNPRAAKAVVSVDANDEKPEAPDRIYLRTARHLYALVGDYGRYAQATTNSIFQQELDIDYTSYEWQQYANRSTDVSVQAPINSDYGFAAIYDGGGHTIRGISFRSAESRIGMFATVAYQGQVRNVILAGGGKQTVFYSNADDKPVGGGSRFAIHMGALVGYNNGNIRNCAVSGYEMAYYGYRSSTASIGALAGTNNGDIRRCEAEAANIEVAATNASVYAGGFAGRNESSITSCYAVGRIAVLDAKNSTVLIGGFAAENSGGAIRRSYSATALTASGEAESYGFTRSGGSAVNCYYLDGGTYAYAGDLYAYGASSNEFAKQAAGTPISGANLQTIAIGDFESAKASYDHDLTEGDTYLYPAVVTDASGDVVHYGNWPEQRDIGTLGIFYWELETGGSNNGYHFSYVGTSQGVEISTDTSDMLHGNSLCKEHDDGGVVAQYGYGYFYQIDETARVQIEPELVAVNCVIPKDSENKTASEALGKQMPGYKFVAYNTATTKTGTDGIYLNTAKENATWYLSYGDVCTYTYSVNPFFANAISLDNIATGGVQTFANAEPRTAKPGTEDNPYEIRSVRQLQFINWNYSYLSAEKVIDASNVNEQDNNRYRRTMYTFLTYSDRYNPANEAKDLYWVQSHDADSYAEYETSEKLFEPIGCLYDTEGAVNSAKSYPYLAMFTSSFDGRAYTIKNVEIRSTEQCIGLFGITAAAELKNIVMYSDRGNVIENKAEGTNWYAIGGLVGFATRGNASLSANKSGTIQNCTVSGYKILDNRKTQPGWGGGSVGGLVGATNMDLSGCTAVTDIVLNVSYHVAYMNLRVAGIAGVARSTISYCYAGGSIKSTTEGDHFNDYTSAQTTSIWVSGIAGGIVLRCQGSLEDLVGKVKTMLTLYNCYSYVQMPETGPNLVAASQSIASSGELQNECFRLKDGDYNLDPTEVRIYNCYALESKVQNTDDYKNKRNSGWSTNGVNLNYRNNGTGRSINIYNTSTPYVSYEAMEGQSFANTLNRSYAGIPALNYGTVTVTEHGENINGKYSFPGSDTALKGLNYPFPTILTQTDVFGNTVNVHYGAWPRYDLLWEESRTTLDLIADVAEDGRATLTRKLYVKDGSTLTENDLTFYDDDGNQITDPAQLPISIALISGYQPDGYYEVTFVGRFTGEIIVRAAVGGAIADMTVQVKAEMLLSTENISIDVGEAYQVVLTLTDKNQKPIAPQDQADLAWAITLQNDDSEAGVDILDFDKAALYYDGEGRYILPVTGFAAGTGLLNVQCTYRYTADGTQAETSRSVQPSVDVKEARLIGLSDGVSFHTVKVADPPEEGATYQDSDAASGPNESGMFLFTTSNLRLEGMTVVSAKLTSGTWEQEVAIWETDDQPYRLKLGGVRESGNYKVQPVLLVTDQTFTSDATLEIVVSFKGAYFALHVTIPANTAADAPLPDDAFPADESQDTGADSEDVWNSDAGQSSDSWYDDPGQNSDSWYDESWYDELLTAGQQ